MTDAKKRMPMNNVDAAWYHMEDPTNLMMVVGVMYFKQPLTLDRLRDVVRKRLLPFDRFRQRVVTTPGMPGCFWEEDPFFDLDYHVVREELSGDGGYLALQERAGGLMSESLDFTRPLWQAHLIENCDEGCAVMLRIHHCIADGIALIGVLLSLTANSAAESLDLPPLPNDAKSPGHDHPGQLFRFAENAIANAGKATAKLFDTLGKPTKILEMAKLGTQGAFTAAKLVMKGVDPPTLFKGDLGRKKIATWSQAIPLADVKRIKNVTKSTVNDVLLTAMSGGLRRYLEAKDQGTKGLSFRATVPVNLRDPSRFRELGNKFGLVFLDLPVGIEDPLDRLFALKKNMDNIKNSPEALVAFGILKAVGMTPAEIQKLIVNVFGKKSTAVMTNVPGPREPLFLGGVQLDHMMFWVPRSGRLGLGISILSYAGDVRLGVATDAGLVPDPNLIIQGFHQELDELLELARQVNK